jgi:hypothetical protein
MLPANFLKFFFGSKNTVFVPVQISDVNRPGRADPKVENLRNTKKRDILIVILHFFNPKATSGLSKITSLIYDIFWQPYGPSKT